MKYFWISSLLSLPIYRKRQFLLPLFLASSLALIPTTSQAQPDFNDAKSLMSHIDQLWRSDSSHVLMSMKVKTSRYERTMRLESWSKGKEKSLIVIRSPKKDKGIATLKVEDNIWNYLPKINRVTKVPASLMSGSWMGSHFTNDDLVKENTYEDDYISSITFKGERDGHSIIEVTSHPKPNAAVVWGKVVTIIDQKNYTPLQASYYDEENLPIRTMSFDKIITQDERILPARLILTPVDKPGESTIVEYLEMNFNLALDDNMFSLQSLQRRH